MRLSLTASLRRWAQHIRHHPQLEHLEGLWSLLRVPYRSALQLLGGRTGIAVDIAGITVRLHPAFATQNWETVEKESYAAFVEGTNAGDVVFDIGAHIGTYSLIAAKCVGTSGRVVAYEPFDQTRAYLHTHLDWNGASERVVVREVCCGAEEGIAEFYYGEGAEGMNGLVPVEGFSSRDVRVVTVDGEVSDLELIPTVVKIDVEGAEMDVLRGAEGTLDSAKPRLYLSLHPDALKTRGTSEIEVLDWLSARGYACRVIARDYEVHVIALPNAVPRRAATAGSSNS